MSQIALNVDPWQIAIGIFGTLVWFIRLEGRIKHLERENDLKGKVIEANIAKQSALEVKVSDLFAAIQASLARIETKVENLESRH
jgi:hypothetical protein